MAIENSFPLDLIVSLTAVAANPDDTAIAVPTPGDTNAPAVFPTINPTPLIPISVAVERADTDAFVAVYASEPASVAAVTAAAGIDILIKGDDVLSLLYICISDEVGVAAEAILLIKSPNIFGRTGRTKKLTLFGAEERSHQPTKPKMEAILFALNNSAKCGGYTHFLQLKAAEMTNRTPIHIIAVIDVSGSMQIDNKLTNVKKSLKAILNFMTATDMLSIVTFSKSSQIVAQKTLTTPENKYILSQAISIMDVDCSTNLSSGLISAFECEGTPEHKTSILLLTDGEANEGITDPDAITDLIRTQCSADTNIYTFGYGIDHNAALLSLIADEKDGAYNVVNSLENVASAIGCAFGSIASCVAQNIAVDGAEFYSGFPKTPQGGVRVGDMSSGGETGILVKNLGNIKIKGFSVQNGFAPFSFSGDELQQKDATAETDKAAYITYMRIKMAEYIEKEPASAELNVFESALEGDDDIIKIMRKEVQEIRRKKSVRFTVDELTVQTQHANFFRNLRSEYSAGPGEQRHPGGDSRGFSMLSPVARNISNGVYTRATRTVADDEEDDNYGEGMYVGNDPSENIISITAEKRTI